MFLLSKLAALMFVLILPSQVHAGRIIGGHEAKEHSRPYMVFLEMQNSAGEKRFCGGFLLNENFVMTAAHCQAKSLVVNLGLHNTHKTEATIPVQQAFPHVDYDDSTFSNDIMLLQLKSKANITKNVKPIALACQDNGSLPQKCLVSGWGQTDWVKDQLSTNLLEINVTLLKSENCAKGKSYCSMEETGPGQGDSGGPLVCEDERAFGVVSSFLKKNNHGPAIFRYTKIPDFIDWINSTMEKALYTNK